MSPLNLMWKLEEKLSLECKLMKNHDMNSRKGYRMD